MILKRFYEITACAFLVMIYACADSVADAGKDSVHDTAHAKILPADSAKADGLLTPSFLYAGDTGHILEPTDYHFDEIWKGASEEKWWGIFRKNNVFSLRETGVNFERVYDPIIDAEGQKTGWLVSVRDRDTCIALLSGLQLREKKLNAVTFERDELNPGKRRKFRYSGIDYELYATGKVVDQVYEDHHLFIKFTRNGQPVDRELFSFREVSDKHFEVIFCGDIDGDTIPDFILETGWHYNFREPALFLSGAAGKNQLYKIVARHKSVGC